MIRKRVIDPILGFLKQGVSPASLALAITVGIVVAYIPVFGVTTLLCLIFIWLLRLNPAIVLLANNLVYPLQFILFLPQLRAGEWLFNAPHVPFSPSQILAMAKENFWNMFSLLWKSTLYGVVVWAIVSIPVGFILYHLLKLLISKISSRQQT